MWCNNDRNHHFQIAIENNFLFNSMLNKMYQSFEIMANFQIEWKSGFQLFFLIADSSTRNRWIVFMKDIFFVVRKKTFNDFGLINDIFLYVRICRYLKRVKMNVLIGAKGNKICKGSCERPCTRPLRWCATETRLMFLIRAARYERTAMFHFV